MDRLFIGTDEVELSPGTVIALNMQINDIAELKDRQANYSQQFSVPKTAQNRLLFEHADLVQSISTKPYKMLACKVVKNGIEVIPAGVIVFENSGATFNLTVYSGIFDFFGKIDGKLLPDLDMSAYDHTYDLATVVSLNGNPDITYPLINYGQVSPANNIIEVKQLRPAICFWTIFTKIITEAGFGYDIPVSISDYLKKIFLPFCGNSIVYDPTFITDQEFRATRTTDLYTDVTVGDNPYVKSTHMLKIICDDDSTGLNHDAGNVYDTATGKHYINLTARHNYAGKVKIFMSSHNLKNDNAKIFFHAPVGVFLVGETVTSDNGATANVLVVGVGVLEVDTVTGNWNVSLSMTGNTSGAHAPLNYIPYQATWNLINETLMARLHFYKNGAGVYQYPLTTPGGTIFTTTRAANPDPDTDTQKKELIFAFDTTGLPTIAFDLLRGDTMEVYVYLEGEAMTQDGAKVLLNNTNTYITAGIEFDGVADTNVVACTNIIVQPFTLGSTLHVSDAMAQMTQTDFIKGISQMMGLIFSHNLFTDEMIIRQFKDIIKNIPVAKDWSAKVHRDNTMLIEMHSSYGQRNHLQYSQDSNDLLITQGVGDGEFDIPDETLPTDTLANQNVLFTLPFAASYEGQYLHRLLDMPFISMIEVATPYDFTLSVVQRVLIVEPQVLSIDVTGVSNYLRYVGSGVIDVGPADKVPVCYFTKAGKPMGLAFGNTLIQDNYTDLISALQSFKKVTVFIKLNDADVYNFDHYIPVFIAQFGNYFYVNKIINYIGKDTLTKVELIRL